MSWEKACLCAPAGGDEAMRDDAAKAAGGVALLRPAAAAAAGASLGTGGVARDERRCDGEGATLFPGDGDTLRLGAGLRGSLRASGTLDACSWCAMLGRSVGAGRTRRPPAAASPSGDTRLARSGRGPRPPIRVCLGGCGVCCSTMLSAVLAVCSCAEPVLSGRTACRGRGERMPVERDPPLAVAVAAALAPGSISELPVFWRSSVALPDGAATAKGRGEAVLLWRARNGLLGTVGLGGTARVLDIAPVAATAGVLVVAVATPGGVSAAAAFSALGAVLRLPLLRWATGGDRSSMREGSSASTRSALRVAL